MDALRHIPSVFFDLIARVPPGAVALVGLWALFDTSWQSHVENVLGATIAASAGASVFLFLGASWIGGQVLSHPGKGVQRIGQLRWVHWWFVLTREARKDRAGCSSCKDDAGSCDIHGLPTSICGTERSEIYDYLRTYRPDLGAQCAKIRAEFTLHDALAAAFVLLAVLYPFGDGPWLWYVQLVLVAVAISEGWRGWKTDETFQKTTVKLFRALHHHQPPPHPHPYISSAEGTESDRG